jgi:hypothetical protein
MGQGSVIADGVAGPCPLTPDPSSSFILRPSPLTLCLSGIGVCGVVVALLITILGIFELRTSIFGIVQSENRSSKLEDIWKT